jgi:hypothetical protein
VSLSNVSAGLKFPDEFNVIVEIPMHSDPVKYEIAKATGAIFVDRLMSTATRYPGSYGYIPQTLAPDGRRLRGGTAGALLVVDVDSPREREGLRDWHGGALSIRMPVMPKDALDAFLIEKIRSG